MEGFIPHTLGRPEQTAFRYIPVNVASDYIYEVGQALYYSSGKLTPASGSNAPEYISMQHLEVKEGVAATICVTPVREDIIYETHAGADIVATPGQKVTVASADTTVPFKAGMRVTGTTSSGTAEIVAIEKDPINNISAGSKGCLVYVKFSV